MRVLIGCEESGTMRRAFTNLGHDAWSCDLKPARDGSNRHYVCDIREVLHLNWDLLMLAHPPCTRLCNSGVRWLREPPGKLNPENYSIQDCVLYALMDRDERLAFMWASLKQGAALFSDCWNAPIERIVVENPIMHGHALALLPSDLPKPQIVQPWWFGDKAFKGTGFYLKNLPPLIPSNKLTPPKAGTAEHKNWSAVHLAAPGPNRSEIRSKTFPNTANACALQWSRI